MERNLRIRPDASFGIKLWDDVVIFKAPVSQALSNLSDDPADFVIASRSCAFSHALSLFGAGGCGFRRRDFRLHRVALATAGAMEKLFDLFDRFLKNKGYLARAGAGCKRFSPEGIKEKREGRALASSMYCAPACMYLVIKGTAWEASSRAPSASSARGAKSK